MPRVANKEKQQEEVAQVGTRQEYHFVYRLVGPQETPVTISGAQLDKDINLYLAKGWRVLSVNFAGRQTEGAGGFMGWNLIYHLVREVAA